MIMFCTDLDNTLIYSYKHEIGTHKVCAEVYQGREVSFLTKRTQELLQKISEKVMVVPVTTRTVEQYGRIALGIGEIPYALVCNGGVLLVNGKEDHPWYAESLERIEDSVQELEKAAGILEKDAKRCMEVRSVNGLFLFTKSDAPAVTAKRLRQALDSSRVDVISQGIKVYVVPGELTKGNAVRRLKEKLEKEGNIPVPGERNLVIATGDSGFDVSMLRCADVGIAPWGLDVGEADGKIVKVGEGTLFSEGMLAWVAENMENNRSI